MMGAAFTGSQNDAYLKQNGDRSSAAITHRQLNGSEQVPGSICKKRLCGVSN